MRARLLTPGLVPSLCVKLGALRVPVRVSLTLACVLACGLTLGSAPALAVKEFPLLRTLALPAEDGGPFSELLANSVAVDDFSGDTLVADSGRGLVQVFDSSGKWLETWNGSNVPVIGSFGGGHVAVTADNATGRVYVLDSGDGVVDVFEASGAYVETWNGSNTPDKSFERLLALTVDQTTGEVYVLDTGHQVVDVFESTGKYLRGIAGLFNRQYGEGVAFDDLTDDVLVSDSGPDAVWEAEASATSFPSEPTLKGAGTPRGSFGSRYVSVAANDSSGDVLVTEDGDNVVDVFDSTGGYLDQITSTPAHPLGDLRGVSVDQATGEIYVSDTGRRVVSVYGGEALTLPGVTVEAVTGVGKKGGTIVATLNGSVDPEGEAVKECYFEYGEAGHFPSGKTAQCEPALGSSAGAVAVKATVRELNPAASYTFRLVAVNAFGEESAFSGEAFETPVAVAGVSACHATGILNESVTLQGTLEPEGLSTSWFFEYRKAGAAGWSRSAEGGVSSPTDKVVEPTEGVAGLTLDTTYECRLVAHNTYGTDVSEEITHNEGHPEPVVTQFTMAQPPEVFGESPSLVGFSGATLRAQINGFGAADSYRFEYGKSEAYGSSTPEVTLQHPVRGETGIFLAVLGLKPATTYHFRVVVTEPDGEGMAIGRDATFTTFPRSAAELPDGRVYEMVSPPEAGGANVYVSEAGNGPFPTPTMMPFQASADGEAVAFVGAPSTGGNGDAGAGGGNEFVAALTPGGWVSRDVMPPGSSSPVYLAFSSDLSVGILESREPLAAGAPGGGYDTLYGGALGGAGALFSGEPKHRSAAEFASAGTVGPRGAGLAYAGASADFSHVLFEANDALAREAREEDPGAGANDLYDSVAGQVSQVNVLPVGEGGGPAPDATFGAPNETSDPADPPDFSHVISADGSRVFWTDLHTGPQEDHVYVREDGSTTVPVSAGAARFWTATPGGRYAFYTEGAGRESRLWRFGVEGAKREALTVAGAGVLGVVGVNEAGEDGSYVYFVAEGKLTAGRNAEGREPLEGQPNLYLLHAGETRFVATLSPEDEGTLDYGGEGGSFGDWEPGLGHRTAELTPDGHSVVFQSVLPLTKYDSEGLSEVFVYDSEEAGGRVLCASCDPSGERPPVSEIGGSRVKAAAYLPISWSRTYQLRVISEDGSRVFFDSIEPLVAADPNGQQDVYEWGRPGTSACGEREGCDYLLSGGTSRSGSYLLDASANGDDVFFVSDAKLVPQDENESDHLYDDRVDGTPPSSPAGCAGTECEQVPLASPIFAAPPSSTFIGVGNFPAASHPSVKAKQPKPKHKIKKRREQKQGRRAKHGRKAARRAAAGRTHRSARRGRVGRS
jgi:hypothetical protein